MESRFKNIKEQLLNKVEAQLSHLDCVDAEELDKVINCIHHLEEAEYYCAITKAMEEKEDTAEYGYRYYNRMTEPYYNNDKRWMYDEKPMEVNSYNGNGMRDRREGKSPMSRKNYMEAKEMHQPKTAQMKELERYLQELSSDIAEMIQDASPEEKAFMEQKISALAAKINV